MSKKQICPDCVEAKPSTDFYDSSRYCIPCHSVRYRLYRQRKGKAWTAEHTARRQRKRDETRAKWAAIAEENARGWR